MEKTKTFSLQNFLNGNHHGGGLYVEDCKIHIQRWSGHDQYGITDITNAMVPGRICSGYSITAKWNSRDSLVVLNWIQQTFGDNLPGLLAFCNGLAWVEGKYGCPAVTIEYQGAEIEIYRRDKESKRTFSPFAALPKLKTAPAKWTLPHVCKALLNGQFKSLRCNGVYTDDYAYDAAVNFREGDLSDQAADFVRRIMESPSGWWAYATGTTVSICCHHFDNNSFTFQP